MHFAPFTAFAPFGALPSRAVSRALSRACLAAAVTAVTAPTASAATLTLDVQGNAAPDSDVMVAIFDNAAHWLKQPARALRHTAGSAPHTIAVPDLPEGDYAVSLFIDVNRNGRLDRNAMGIPTEPFAFSNDAAGTFGPPSFEQARLHVAGDTRAVIRLP